MYIYDSSYFHKHVYIYEYICKYIYMYRDLPAARDRRGAARRGGEAVEEVQAQVPRHEDVEAVEGEHLLQRQRC